MVPQYAALDKPRLAPVMARHRIRPIRQPNATRPVGSAAARARPMQATTTADGVALASWWWRALAVLID